MSLFLRAVLNGQGLSFLLLFNLGLSAAYNIVCITYPLFRAVRQRGRMRAICIMLSASAGTDLASELVLSLYGPKPSSHDLADAASPVGPVALLLLIAPSLAAIFGIVAGRRWAAYLYMAMLTVSVVARALDTEQLTTAVYMLDALSLALDGAMLGLSLLARDDDMPAPQQISSVF